MKLLFSLLNLSFSQPKQHFVSYRVSEQEVAMLQHIKALLKYQWSSAIKDCDASAIASYDECAKQFRQIEKRLKEKYFLLDDKRTTLHRLYYFKERSCHSLRVKLGIKQYQLAFNRKGGFTDHERVIELYQAYFGDMRPMSYQEETPTHQEQSIRPNRASVG